MTSKEETPFDKLPSYKKTLRMEQVGGEKSGLRLIQLTREDLEQYKIIDRVFESFHEKSDQELINEVKQNRPGRKGTEEYFFGVAGTEEVDPKEIGKLQGWIEVFEVNRQRIKGTTLFNEIKDDSTILEIAYGKDPNAPPHQMASAVRQVCIKMSRIDALMHQDLEHITHPQMTIVANVLPSNEKSKQVLLAAGFEPAKKDQSVTSYSPYDIYVLKWDILEAIEVEKRKKISVEERKPFPVSERDLFTNIPIPLLSEEDFTLHHVEQEYTRATIERGYAESERFVEAMKKTLASSVDMVVSADFTDSDLWIWSNENNCGHELLEKTLNEQTGNTFIDFVRFQFLKTNPSIPDSPTLTIASKTISPNNARILSNLFNFLHSTGIDFDKEITQLQYLYSDEKAPFIYTGKLSEVEDNFNKFIESQNSI